jgi:beta-galactosidase
MFDSCCLKFLWNLKFEFWIFISLLPLLSAAAPRATYDFNPSWLLLPSDPPSASSPTFDDSTWQTITLPHAWNEDAAFKVAIAQHPTGIAWYRKHFKLPAEANGKKLFLEFEGVRQAGEFWLNGKFIGCHENGVMAVGFDITTLARFDGQENVLAVRTDNNWQYREKETNQRFQWNDRNFNANFGGITKNVRLHVTGKLYQTLPLYSQLKSQGVYIYATDFDIPGRSALIYAEAEIKNENPEPRAFSFEVRIEDMDSRLVKQFSGTQINAAPNSVVTARASARVDHLNFWSWGYGYLYNVDTVLKVDGVAVDVVRTRTGFRKTEFSRGYVKLNDRALHLKGYAQRTSNEWPALGSAVPPWLSDFSNRLMVEDNAHLVRWMHITPWKQDVESCDRVGLLEAMPAGDSEGDARGRQWEQRVEVMRDAIIYNRNNPSIVFYESGNKGVSEAHMREMKELRDRFDPHGGRAAGAREMLGSHVAEYGGEMLYVNKSAGIPFWEMEYSRDEGMRLYWDDFSPPFHKDGDGPDYRGASAREYNRNQDSHAIEDVVRWYDFWRERPGIGERVNGGAVNIIFSDSNTHCRGAENYRRSGEVDAMRLPKDGYWAHQVIWDGWVDIERPRIHIIGHWNYSATTTKPVYVVSSAPQVELFLNEKSLGKGKQTSHFLYTFPDVHWQPGVLKAVGLDSTGSPLCSAEKITTGEPVALKLSPLTGPAGLKADGADVALIDVEVVDSQGRRCPTAQNAIEFTLTGPAEWRGGIAKGPGNCILAKTLPVECGINRVLLRSLPQPGLIRLSATAPGLKPASLEISSTAANVSCGLSPCPQTLPSYLERGPTPPSPSFKPSRILIPILTAEAGTNSDQAKATFDDNETTSWSNDGTLTTAWLTYHFARPATPAEATLKLAGWRQRTYPLRITVDNHEVFRGLTPRSLGYVTLPLNPITGQTLKIELTGPVSAQEAFNITEVTASSKPTPRASSKSTLSIIEFECYEIPSH